MITKETIKLNNISKTFQGKIALSSLSFNVNKGDKIALIGPSGAGKTTLLNILIGVMNSDTGDLIIDGTPSDKYKSRKARSKKIGIIRQQFDLVNQLPVIHNVLAGKLGEWSFFKSMLSLVIPQEKELAVNSLERVGILDKIYERTSNLSGGEQQRVALARLLVQNPEIILADEPIASLDPARSEDILSTLINLTEENNQTLVASLHSVEYAKKYFTRIIALKNGEVFFDLPADKVSDEDLKTLYDFKELS